MKKIVVFIKGAVLSSLALLAIALIMCVGLLATGSELIVGNPFITIYCADMNASVNFGSIPTLLVATIGGLLSVKKYNAKLNNNDDVNESSQEN